MVSRNLVPCIALSGLVHALPIALLNLKKDQPIPALSHPPLAIKIEWQQEATTQVASPAKPSRIIHQKTNLSTIPHQIIDNSEDAPSSSLPIEQSESLPMNVASSNRKPIYPEEARLLGIEGTVLVAITITPHGKIQEIHIKEPKAHPLLEESALNQIKSWSFPQSLTSQSFIIPVKFELE